MLNAIPFETAVAIDVLDRELPKHDFLPLISAGRLSVIKDITELEAEHVVTYAAALGGDGEAFTAAIAINRGWTMATDETRVIRYFATVAPTLQIWTTPRIVMAWRSEVKPSEADIKAAIQGIERDGNYRVGTKNPYYADWHRYSSFNVQSSSNLR